MSDLLKYAIELVAVLLLALGIKGLSKVRSARGANQLAAVAMGLAVLGLLVNYLGTDAGISALAWTWIIGGTVVGGVLGAITAQRVPMTSMPETVALFNGCGGMSSLLVALAAALYPAALDAGTPVVCPEGRSAPHAPHPSPRCTTSRRATDESIPLERCLVSSSEGICGPGIQRATIPRSW